MTHPTRPKPHRLAVLLVLALVATSTASAGEPQAPAAGYRLADATSPYLQQHASNPVEWYPWGEEAFERARREDKFIFLSVGYSTCFWCHVMERESFSDPEIAAVLNRHAISIKVDREERPDVDAIYMTAVQMMAGHGGWPMNLLLTHDLKPFFAATYLSPSRLTGLMEEARSLWEENRPAVEGQAARVAVAIQNAAALTGTPRDRVPPLGLLDDAVARLATSFDPFDGGFEEAPKFPHPSILELLLTHHQTTGDARSLEMATVTLDAMARGGIHDQVGGGFHRYAIDNQWLVPHFEKMLYDNAQLLHVYARAHEATGNPVFARVARGIVDHVARDMTRADGLFYSALDSQVEGEEGKTYLWTAGELRALLEPEQYALARRVWGLDGPPDFEGAHILHWPRAYEATAKAEDLTVPALLDRMEPIRARLQKARDRRPQPRLDDKVITAWNAQMIWALAYAGEVLEAPAYVAMAERAAEALLAGLRDEAGGMQRVNRASRSSVAGYLDDHAATVLALLEVRRVTGDDRWHREALAVADAMIAAFADPAGGFHYAPPSVEHLLVRAEPPLDGAMPAGNSLAVRALTALGRHGDPRSARHAAATLRAYGLLLERAPDQLPHMLWGLADYHHAGLPLEGPLPRMGHTAGRTPDGLRATARVSAEDPRRLAITLHLAEGWHVNATPASLEFLVPTRVTAQWAGRALELEVDYPRGREMDTGLGSPIRVYDDGERIPVMLDAPLPAGAAIRVRAQACSEDGRCLAPREVEATVTEAAETG